ncbi:hypothetical protein [Hymenobacter persicinus]|uniref:hypothetical protein n=1 Tax=Hymenobacter persicinus TaxID=2025506 RepID=UPI001F5D623B|nr:hypothetical protein [Hymenobacter persicinus]
MNGSTDLNTAFSVANYVTLKGGSATTATLPTTNNTTGRIIYLRNDTGRALTLNTTLTLAIGQTRMFIYDGTTWVAI